jgi:glutamine cyclotransferase
MMTKKASMSHPAIMCFNSWLLVLVVSLFPACSNHDATPWYTGRVVNTYPHDRGAFTQGLVWEDGFLYEGTGLNGNSSLRMVELETGNVLKRRILPGQYFGEGITIFQGRIMQLTWRSRTGFVYDKESFELLQHFFYETEGWGLTHDGKRLIMSTGGSNLYFLDPATFRRTGQLYVHDHSGPVGMLNELEYVKGEIYANVWKTDTIARIDPETGRVTGWIRLDGLLSGDDYEQPVDVLNGIAYDDESDRLFVTGKLWPKLFEITLVPIR